MHEAHSSSPVSPLYSLDEYLEWSTQFGPFDAAEIVEREFRQPHADCVCG